jgi:D-alanyl-D-alanine carboxypeptidase/D-alanyl-D-alanine-endopeptidase (penicillin-binding protein 4)
VPRRGLAATLVALAVACTASTTTATPPPTSTTNAPSSVALPSSASASHAEPTPSIVIEHAVAPWTDALDRITDVPGVSVAVGAGGRILYEHAARAPATLASNEKLLTSMTVLDRLGPGYRFRTIAAIRTGARDGGDVSGDLWLMGAGDPTLEPDDLAALAARVATEGIRRVDGDVVGDTTMFDRGWWAPGWLPGISRSFVARPVALRLATSDAALEAAAAASFRDALVGAGVTVVGTSKAGAAPTALDPVGSVVSPPARDLLEHQNHESDNLYAELFTKALGRAFGDEGSTADGANVIQAWAAAHGAGSTVRDGSGLSDQDQSSADDVAWLLLQARRAAWFPVLLASLPAGGDGTLTGRLVGVPVRAKTGTLFVRPTSTLSGYVQDRNGRLVAFSVLTHALPEYQARSIEDAVVRTLAAATVT